MAEQPAGEPTSPASQPDDLDLFDSEQSPPSDGDSGAGTGIPAPERSLPDRDEHGRFVKPGSTPPNPHPNYLVKQARSFGVAPETILSFTTEQLGDLVSDIQDRLLQERAYNSQAQAHSQAREAQQAEPEEPTLDPFKEQLIPEMATYLEHRDKELASLKKELRDAINEQKQVAQRLLQAEQTRQQHTFYDKCDQLIAKHRKVIGEGRASEIQPGTPTFIRYDAAIQAASRMAGGLTQENVDKAVAGLFGSQSEQPSGFEGPFEGPAAGGGHETPPAALTDNLGSRAQEWANAGLRRPTNRQGAKEPREDPKERATRSVARVLAGIDRAEKEANGSIGDEDFLE